MVNHEVENLECDAQGRIKSIQVRDLESNQIKTLRIADDDYVVSTLPLSLNARFLKSQLSDKALDVARNVVKLNDLVLVFLHIEADELTENSWIFVPDPEIIFHRLSEQNSFDESMVPSGSIVCCEIMSSDQRPLADKSDNELVEACLAELVKLDFSNPTVKQSKVIRLPRSYPVYEVGFENRLSALISEFDALPNFKTIGRQGAFNYIGTLDAMDIGFGAAEWIIDRDKDWQIERERTEHFPVLD